MPYALQVDLVFLFAFEKKQQEGKLTDRAHEDVSLVAFVKDPLKLVLPYQAR